MRKRPVPAGDGAGAAAPPRPLADGAAARDLGPQRCDQRGRAATAPAAAACRWGRVPGREWISGRPRAT